MAGPGEDDDMFDFYNPETQKIEKRPKSQTYSTYLMEGASDSDNVAKALYRARQQKGFKTYRDPSELGPYAGNDD